MRNLAKKIEADIPLDTNIDQVELRIINSTAVKEDIRTQHNKQNIRTYTYLLVKRIIDIISAIVGIILLVPIMLMVKIAYLKDGDNAPILFKQTRIGKGGKKIDVYKIRSMVVDADNLLMNIIDTNPDLKKEYSENKKLRNDPRITKIGNFIRRTSIDEFPQFINVLKGDMSLVGPRPYLHREKEDMGNYYEDIINCKPGITGLWQIRGRSNVCFKNRCKLDSFYNKHKSFLLDFKIFLKTFYVVLKKDGAM